MFQAPARIWNEIAETQELRTDWAQLMFPLPADEQQAAVDYELERVTRETGSPVVAAAYLVTMPLLWECQAIRAYQEMVGPQGSLPMIETVAQALAVAQGDYLLTAEEVETLILLLLREPDAAA